MTVSLSTLLSAVTASGLFTRALEIAAALGLPVTSWREDDPTRAQFAFQATILEEMSAIQTQFAKSGFLSTAEDDWLTLHAKEVFNVDRNAATYATPSVTLVNTQGGFYPRAAGDLRFKSSITGKTYTSTSAGTLSAGAVVTFTTIADEPGADSATAEDEIDELVTTLLGVEISGSTVSTASDEESPEALIARCKATTAALSPNGPADAYEYVATTPSLSGTSVVTRAYSVTTGDHEVTTYLRSATGTVAAPDVALVQAAFARYATPLTITAIAASASAVVVNFEIFVSGEDLPADLEARVETRLGTLFAALNVGETLSLSRMISAIHGVDENITSVELVEPTATQNPADSEVLVLGYVDVAEV